MTVLQADGLQVNAPPLGVEAARASRSAASATAMSSSWPSTGITPGTRSTGEAR